MVKGLKIKSTHGTGFPTEIKSDKTGAWDVSIKVDSFGSQYMTLIRREYGNGAQKYQETIMAQEARPEGMWEKTTKKNLRAIFAKEIK